MEIPSSIVFSRQIADDLKGFFEGRHFSKVAVLVDDNTKKHCYPLVADAIPQHLLIEIKSGEEQKTLRTCEHIWGEMTIEAFDRKTLFVNIGGGVIGDMGGFCAATYKRGIDFINIPTTLLAQVDASIGGKLGVDFNNFKNHIGVFQDPRRVFLDPIFFETLHPNELRSGFAEIIKHCLIRDEEMFQKLLLTPFANLDLFELTRHSVQIKNDVVLNDPKEGGLRKILNFGHTIGHAIESFYLEQPDKKLLHGEAIAIGMICEAFLSNEKLNLKKDELNTIADYILSIFDSRGIDSEDIEEITEHTIQDKKNEGDKINCSLLNKIGDCAFNIQINKSEIKRSIEYFNECARR